MLICNFFSKKKSRKNNGIETTIIILLFSIIFYYEKKYSECLIAMWYILHIFLFDPTHLLRASLLSLQPDNPTVTSRAPPTGAEARALCMQTQVASI